MLTKTKKLTRQLDEHIGREFWLPAIKTIRERDGCGLRYAALTLLFQSAWLGKVHRVPRGLVRIAREGLAR